MTVGTVTAECTETSLISTANAVAELPASGNLAFNDVLRSRGQLTSGRADLDAIFEAAGRRYNLPPNLLKAVAKVESDFRPHLVSRVGAQGIMQIMPATAQYLGVTDPFDPEQSIMGGARYLREQIDRFNGDLELALAAYNAGWPAVVRHGGIPPFRETQNYVPKVLGYYGGGEITAGFVNFDRFGVSNRLTANGTSSSREASAASSAVLSGALTQMLLINIIQMQMNSSGDNKDKRVF